MKVANKIPIVSNNTVEVTQLTATGVNYPISKQTGQTFQIFGNIASPNYLEWVQCYVLDSTQNGVLWAGYGFTDAEKAQKVKTYNVNWLDARMAFASLPAGTYTYCVEALDDKGYFVRVANNFTVSSSGTTSGTETKVGTHDHTRNSNYTWGSWSTIKSATCTTEGKQTRTCYCGEVETKTISAKGHTYDDDQDPDCNTCGYLRNPSAVQLLSYTISNGEATITDCHSGISGDFTIPSTLGAYPVTSIGDYAFYDCKYLTSITIPNSVTSIGGSAFSFCKSLTSITIPDSVTSIGPLTFNGCESLTSIAIPDGVTSIGFSTFHWCESLTNITIPNSVTSIGDFAFESCTSLNNVYYRGTEEDKNKITIDSYNTELTNATWYYNSCIGKANHTLIKFSCPPGCETEGRIETTACMFCDYQEDGEIIPPTGHNFNRQFVSTAYKATDGDCTHRATYYYSCVCGKAGTETFTDYREIVPGYHTYDNDCDTNCNKCGAVRDVSMIVRGTCGDNVTWYLNTDTKVLTLTGTGATYNYVNVGNVNPFVEHRANIKSIVIGDGITHLGNRLFRGLNHTTSVTFGKDVVTMGYEVFYVNSKLANVTLNEGLTMLGALTFYNCTALKQINIPSTVTNLQNRAFKGSGLTSVVVPDTVKTLGYEVFMNCANLETVDFTEGCSMLNPRMFENCTSLKEFNFTRNMCRIRSRAFYGCTALQSITFEDADNMWGSSNGQEAKIASNAFEGCNSTLQMIAKKGSHVESYTSRFGFTFVAK